MVARKVNKWPGRVILLLALTLIGAGVWMYFDEQNTAAAQQQAWAMLSKEFTEHSDSGRVIDFDALRAINPDVVAWIYVPGTYVDYPVVQTTNNELYLDHNFERSWCAAGSIFLDAGASSDFSDIDTYIFGHHMRSGAMFGSLVLFRDASFAQRHNTIHIYTPIDSRVYSVIDTGLISAERTIEPPRIVEGEYYITLVTCEYDFDDARFWVRAMLIDVTRKE